MPQLRGRLIDLATQSDVVALGTVERLASTAHGGSETTVRVERLFGGTIEAERIAFTGGPRAAPGQRYVFFLGAEGATLTCL